jgi:hypothetical protein
MFDLSEQSLYCPYCGERISVVVDGSETQQAYIEDCEVCCRPIVLSIAISPSDEVTIEAAREDE